MGNQSKRQASLRKERAERKANLRHAENLDRFFNSGLRINPISSMGDATARYFERSYLPPEPNQPAAKKPKKKGKQSRKNTYAKYTLAVPQIQSCCGLFLLPVEIVGLLCTL